MKAFNQFLVDLNDGSTHAGLTADLAELFAAVQNTGRGGSLTLKVKVASASKGGFSVDKVTITADRKLELPKPETPQDFFWLTDDAQPTRHHPRQNQLDLRSAGDERGGLRIFKNGDGYRLVARLKYRLHSGNVKFWFELDRYERAVELAFTGYVDALREKAPYQVLLGTP